MSEFHCPNGHLMLSTDGPRCRICGMPVHTMDGMTATEMAQREWMEPEEEDKDDD